MRIIRLLVYQDHGARHFPRAVIVIRHHVQQLLFTSYRAAVTEEGLPHRRRVIAIGDCCCGKWQIRRYICSRTLIM